MILPVIFGFSCGLSLFCLFLWAVMSRRGEGGKEGGVSAERGVGSAQWSLSPLKGVSAKLSEYGVKLDPQDLLAFMLAGGIGGFLLLYALLHSLLFALLLSPVLTVFSVWMFVSWAGDRRQERVSSQLLIFLENYHARLQGGGSPRQAFMEVYEAMTLRPLREVLEPAYTALRGGRSFVEAISEASRAEGGRTPALDFLAQAVVVQSQTGAGIEGVISSVKEGLRSQHVLRKQLRTKIISQVWVARILSALVPTAFLLLLALKRDLALELLRDPLGILVLGLAVGLTIGGFYLVNKLIVEVRKII